MTLHAVPILHTDTHICGAVQVAVGDGFHVVVGEDVGAAFEIGDGAGDFEDAVVGPRGHVHVLHGIAVTDYRHDRKDQKLSLLMTLNSELE